MSISFRNSTASNRGQSPLILGQKQNAVLCCLTGWAWDNAWLVAKPWNVQSLGNTNWTSV